MIEARHPTTPLAAQPVQRAGPLCAIVALASASARATTTSNSHRDATSLSVPFRP